MKLTRELRANEKIVLDAMGQTAEALLLANYGLRGLLMALRPARQGCLWRCAWRCTRHARDAVVFKHIFLQDVMQDEINQAQECGALHDN